MLLRSHIHRPELGTPPPAAGVPALVPSGPSPDPLVDPTLPQLAANFAQATHRWAKAGFPRVKKRIYHARLATCRACPHWAEDARLGLGSCRHKGCGCTRLKLWLATERCPLTPPRWS